MRLLSPILCRLVYPALGSVGYFHFRPPFTVNAITYHGVLPAGYESKDAYLDNTLVSAEAFRSQLRFLKKYYNVISPDQFLLWLRRQQELPERAILLTCDDGLLNHLTTMLPILREEELKCLFFVTGSSLGNTPEMLWYVELYLLLMEARAQAKSLVLRGVLVPQIPADLRERRSIWQALLKTLSRIDAAGRRGFMEEAWERFGLPSGWRGRYLDDSLLRERFQLLRVSELKELANAGMTVGAHTMSHPALAEQSPDMARFEISECRSALETSLGRKLWAIAYPFGDAASVGGREYKLAEEAGYDCAFVNVGGGMNSASRRFALPRIHVTAEMPPSVYEAYVSGFHHAIRNRFS